MHFLCCLTGTNICRGVNRYPISFDFAFRIANSSFSGADVCLLCLHSSDLYSHLSMSTEVSCNVTLETYACAQVAISFKRVKVRFISESSFYAPCCLFWLNDHILSHTHSWTTSQPISWCRL